ncbi:MAG: PAS domain-containing sensor histidine kinase [Beijerinckiaceae bacterium]
MNVSRSLAALTFALVHPAGLQSALETARHQTFMLRTLTIVFFTLASAPLFLAFHGAPSPAETAIFSFCLAPIGAVMLVSKTGQLDLGHLICVLCLIGLSTTLAMTTTVGLSCALAWLIVAQTESLLSFNNRLMLWSAAACVAVFAVLAVLVLWNPAAPPRSGTYAGLLTGLALALAAINTLSFAAQRRLNRGAEDERNNRLASIADTVDDIVVSYDANGTADFVSPACEQRFGLPAHSLMGRGLFEHIHVADRPIFLKAIADAAHGDQTVTVSVRLRGSLPPAGTGHATDQSFFWIEMRARRLTRPGSNPGVISLLRDITGIKQVIGDLEAARQSAEAASQTRDQFLANMSHELRTPLNAIIGFSEVLGDPALRPADPAKQKEYAGIIHQSGQHLLSVVNSILDMSKLQSGTFSIIPEHFDVGPLIDSCCEIVTLKAQEGHVEIVRSYRQNIDPVVGDRRACKQILINLLSNAVKFTPKNGRVTVSARPEGNSLLICVSDTGIGIAAADLTRLGDPFFQAKSSLDRPFEGTGLGLSVVRGLVGLHGGTISIESEPGHGTSVSIRLPLDCRHANPAGMTAKIETIARRHRPERPFPQQNDQMVKKIA